MMEEVHSCSFYCQKPECIKRQRDEMRDAQTARVSTAPQEPLYVIFDGPCSHESGRFVEVENERGQSVRVGEWQMLPDGLWSLGPLYAAPQPPAAPQEPATKYAVDPIRADESLALSEKIMDRVVATGSAYLKLELVDPTAPQPQAPSSDDVRDAARLDWICEEAEYTCGQLQVVIQTDGKVGSFVDAIDAAIQRDKADATRNAD